MAAHFLLITAKANFGGSNDAVNTWHYSADGSTIFGPDDASKTAQANEAIDQLKVFYTALNNPGLSNTWTIGSSVIEYQTGQPPRYVTATPQDSDLGSGAVSGLQLACCLSWRTALAGKSYRGRTFLGPLTAPAFAMPSIDPTFVGRVNTAAAALIAAPGVGDLVPAVYSPTLDITTRITSGLATTKCRTMRSRAE